MTSSWFYLIHTEIILVQFRIYKVLGISYQILILMDIPAYAFSYVMCFTVQAQP